MKTSSSIWIVVVFVSQAACGNRQAPSSGTEVRQSALVGAVAPSAPGREYRHTLARSRFDPGAAPTSRSELGLDKLVGANGVFATDPVTGAAWASPNADAPAYKRPPLTTDGDTHNQRVISYFQSAGIPAAEIKNAHVTTLMETGGASNQQIPAPKLTAYYSILARAVDGISVPDSFAWARFNADDQVVEEGVYWPPIPASVVDAAKKLASTLADPAAGPKLRAALPSAAAPEEVVIRHTNGADHSPFQAVAYYDVPVSLNPGVNGRQHLRHFDIDGKEHPLPGDQDPSAHALPSPLRKVR
jgi:hypothetical protein